MTLKELVVLLSLLTSSSAFAVDGRDIGEFVEIDEAKAQAYSLNHPEVLSRSRRSTTSNSIDPSISRDFSYRYVSYAKWDYTNTSGSCKYLIFQVTNQDNYNQLFHKLVQPWQIVSNPRPDIENEGGVITYKPIKSIACNAELPGISY